MLLVSTVTIMMVAIVTVQFVHLIPRAPEALVSITQPPSPNRRLPSSEPHMFFQSLWDSEHLAESLGLQRELTYAEVLKLKQE